ncbi:alpha/beta hydrolase family protein [Glaciecola sp. MF2-115]|uniref:alpha/beta hydrolase family protein n=1 Tax=Glaciecola sp. MF2-115 TaxID=3384827 RepID=UPI0039A28FB1
MFLKQKLIAIFSVAMLLPSTLIAKDYEHSDLIESFAVLPALQQVSVSPDGKKIIIMRATSKDGDYILEVRQTDKITEDPVLFGSEHMEIQSAFWLNNELMAVNFSQNIQDGNRNYYASKFAIVQADGKGDWRVPFPKDNQARFSLISVLRDDPKNVLISYDINDDRLPDIVKYNIYNGRTRTILRANTKLSSGFIPDNNGEIRAANAYDAKNNSLDQYVRLTPDDEWELIFKNRAENREQFDFLSFSRENPQEVFISANRGHDTTGIYTYNIETKEYSERLFGLENVDVDDVILSNKEADRGRLLGFSYEGKHPTAYWLDEYEENLRKAIKAAFPGKYVSLASRSEDDNQIVVRTSASNDPGTYYLLSNKKDVKVIGERFPLIDRDLLGDVKYIKYTARDGLKIPAYVTIPKVGKKPYPTVVMPHGGPWVRDTIIYDEWAQLLASHGYMVLQPNYRGSTGFGLNHWKKGDNNWGQTMQDDKDDGAKFLIDKGLADPERMAIFGWSYGGYAAFAASVRENGPFKCAIAGAGVSDINRIGASLFNRGRYGRVFQGKTVTGLSPIENAEKLAMPLFIIHGDIDQRVPVEQSRLMVDKLKSLGKPYKYLELEGADHFYNTLYYRHKSEFYPAMIDWLENSCFTDSTIAKQ